MLHLRKGHKSNFELSQMEVFGWIDKHSFSPVGWRPGERMGWGVAGMSGENTACVHDL